MLLNNHVLWVILYACRMKLSSASRGKIMTKMTSVSSIIYLLSQTQVCAIGDCYSDKLFRSGTSADDCGTRRIKRVVIDCDRNNYHTQ